MVTYNHIKEAKMITNTIMFKLKEKTGENRALAREKLLGLKGAIPQLKDIRIEFNTRGGPSGFDVLMIAVYDSMQDFDEYIAHPAHVEAGQFVLGLCEQTASVCYES
jgi:hypothetical protein